MRLVADQQEPRRSSLMRRRRRRKVVEQGHGGLAGLGAGEMPRVVLDPRTRPRLPEELEVPQGALLEALGVLGLPRGQELVDAASEFALDVAADAIAGLPFLGRRMVRRRPEGHLLDEDGAGRRKIPGASSRDGRESPVLELEGVRHVAVPRGGDGDDDVVFVEVPRGEVARRRRRPGTLRRQRLLLVSELAFEALVHDRQEVVADEDHVTLVAFRHSQPVDATHARDDDDVAAL
mmetsp:Transcript_32793/g.104567  ORF Transcript_32793/g.104567 Transcript_32793/m.104567 type:complete len:235 (+) Transcript_32793:1030-1734(+)